MVWEEECVARLDLEEGEPASLLIDKANIDSPPYFESVYLDPKIGERFYMTKSGLEALQANLLTLGLSNTGLILTRALAKPY